MIQLTKGGLAGSLNHVELASQFEQSHVFRLPALLNADLIHYAASRLHSCAWIARNDGTIAREEMPDSPALAGVLNFAANTSEFLDLIRGITGCRQITWFSGRVYRMLPAENHFDSWHSDVGTTQSDRLLGMSVNLGARPYEGGRFRLRDESSGTVLCELPNTSQGDAIFFRISPALKHMVTPVEGMEPKVAFAGWFRSGKVDYYGNLPRPVRA